MLDAQHGWRDGRLHIFRKQIFFMTPKTFPPCLLWITAIAMTAASGCTRYVVAEGSTLFVGSFCKEERRISTATYQRIEGVGLKLGAFRFGAGRFDSAVLIVPVDTSAEIQSPIADVKVFKTTQPEP